MSINLIKNKDSLDAAWTSVVDDKSPTNWAVFSYEGQTNNLKVVSTGKNGLEEMIDELNEGQIMYAFCRVIDTKTTLPKCVLINWQGEGAPIVRKGTCANHIRDLERLLKGAHITISARSEEDVEVDLIMEKLSRATGSSYQFNEKRTSTMQNGGSPGRVGSTYQRVNPEKEIDASERDQFWQKEEKEEKQRIEQEKARREQNRRKIEEEVRKREEPKPVPSEQLYKANPINSQQRVEEIKNLRKQSYNTMKTDPDNETNFQSRSEELRRERKKEAQQLIGQRTIMNARAVFEQNSIAGQTRTPLVLHHPKKAVSNNIDGLKNNFTQNQLEEEVKINRSFSRSPVRDKIATIKEDPHAQPQTVPPQQPAVVAPVENTIVCDTNNSVYENNVSSSNGGQEIEINNDHPTDSVLVEETTVNDPSNEVYEQLDSTQYLYLDPNNHGMTARALYDYEAADETEITFDPGDIITHIDTIDEGWWQGLAPDGTYGLFPANHVEVIEYRPA